MSCANGFTPIRSSGASFAKSISRSLLPRRRTAALQQLYELQKKRRRLTLLFASKNEERNNALVLKQLLDGERKPPTGTGPIRAAAIKRGRAARPR